MISAHATHPAPSKWDFFIKHMAEGIVDASSAKRQFRNDPFLHRSIPGEKIERQRVGVHLNHFEGIFQLFVRYNRQNWAKNLLSHDGILHRNLNQNRWSNKEIVNIRLATMHYFVCIQ
jgi:hypothetical protein